MNKHIALILTLLWPVLAHAQMDGARWIGTSQSVLYAQYLPQFRLSATLQLDRATGSTRAALLFGGNDRRLMSRAMNILGVERGRDESYIKLELRADGPTARLDVWRIGYTTAGIELMAQMDIPTDVVNPANRYEPHTVSADCALGNVELSVDGRRIGRVGLNPLGNGGDYIAFPQLADIGWETEAGQRATLSDVRVQHLRSPHAVIYADTVRHVIGHPHQPSMHLADPSHGGMPLLERTFSLKPKPVRSATLTATARGIYHATLNGQPVGREYLAPGLSQYNKTHYCQTADVTPLLDRRPGRANRLRAELAEGWWAGAMTYGAGNWNHFGDQLAFLARLVVRYADGDSTVVTTQPGEWRVTTDGPVRYASLFQGEVHDLTPRRLRWAPAEEMTLDGHLPTEGGGTMPRTDDYAAFRLLPAETAVEPFDTLTAQSVTSPAPGVYIYDMGQNMAGVPLVSLPRTDAELTLRYAEVLYPDLPQYAGLSGTMMLENIRAAMAQDRCTVTRDTPHTTFAPRATLHGYRYIEITGLSEPLPLTAVRSIVLSSVHHFTADYECSNPLVNRLWQNIRWSMLANFISIPTDCPQRNERMGWSGDIGVFAPTAVALADVSHFLRKHMQAMRDVQTPEGRFPDVAPVGGGFGGLLWGSAGITVPWECYMQYADTALLRQHYPAMQAYIRYVDRHYIDPQTSLLVQHRQWGDLGDWLGLEDAKNDKTLLFEAYYIHDLDIMERTAHVLGLEDDAAQYAARRQQRRRHFIDTYVDPTTGRTVASAYQPHRQRQPVDIQGSYVLPLAFHIATDTLRQKMLDNLVSTIERHNTTDDGTPCPPYSLMTGFITTAWISLALSDGGRTDTAYRLLQQTTYPSWLYPVTQGATTIWERLNSYTHTDGFGRNNAMNSFNHYAFGAVGHWLLSRSIGIDRDPDHPAYQHFCLRPEPDPTGLMTYARGHVDTRFGRIESAWHTTPDGTVHYDFTVPAGTTATLLLPGQPPRTLAPGRHTF